MKFRTVRISTVARRGKFEACVVVFHAATVLVGEFYLYWKFLSSILGFLAPCCAENPTTSSNITASHYGHTVSRKACWCHCEWILYALGRSIHTRYSGSASSKEMESRKEIPSSPFFCRLSRSCALLDWSTRAKCNKVFLASIAADHLQENASELAFGNNQHVGLLFFTPVATPPRNCTPLQP